MRAELGDFAGRFFADVNGDADDADKGANKDKGDQPRRNVTDAQGVIKRDRAVHGRRRVQKDFRDPRHQDQDEDENVIALQPAPDRFQLADFEAGQNQIFANEFFPFALQEVAIFHHHRDEEMRFQHPDAGAEGVVKPVTACLDPEHHPNDR